MCICLVKASYRPPLIKMLTLGKLCEKSHLKFSNLTSCHKNSCNVNASNKMCKSAYKCLKIKFSVPLLHVTEKGKGFPGYQYREVSMV